MDALKEGLKEGLKEAEGETEGEKEGEKEALKEGLKEAEGLTLGDKDADPASSISKSRKLELSSSNILSSFSNNIFEYAIFYIKCLLSLSILSFVLSFILFVKFRRKK